MRATNLGVHCKDSAAALGSVGSLSGTLPSGCHDLRTVDTPLITGKRRGEAVISGARAQRAPYGSE
jgi:hypothetical protein